MSTERKSSDLSDLKKSLKASVKTVDPDLQKWIGRLYSDWLADKSILDGLHNLHKYHGFSRDRVLEELKKLADTHGVSTVIELIVICALKGPAKAAMTQLSNGKTVASLGIPKSAPRGNDGLSCNRITAATADLAAYYLKQMDVPKKLDLELPGWLQFPSAASIKLPEKYQAAHKEFAEKFSVKIGGEFNEDIYLAMRANSYLNDSLNLF